ncbi:MAG: hypothetical protein CVU89_04995 [Firmicutes bacterium HGW-Firmicutes-14]|nr:MAG: hypothetical protein CVU89_04995 [Firmicutes bacterium HGW-Firmicutes-14]
MYQKVCLIKYRGVIAPYVMDCYVRAFREAGLMTFILDLAELGQKPAELQQKINQLISWKPDLAVSYGHTGLLNAKEGYLFRVMGIPLVILHYDCPFFVLDETVQQEFTKYPDNYYHFIWDKSFLGTYRQNQIKNSYHIMLAADPANFRPEGSIDNRPIDYNTDHNWDVSFIGGISDFMAMKKERMEKQPLRINEFLDRLIMAKIENPSIPVLDIWKELNNEGFPELVFSWNNPMLKKLYHAAHREGSMLIRRVFLDSIQAAVPDVFGAQWENPSINFHGRVDYFSELPRIYAESRINLNITSLQLEKALNNRIFDIGAAGGFMLTDYREDLKEVFPDYEHITYHSIDDLNDKISYFLFRDGERAELARELQKAVLAGHTYTHRVEYIINVLKGKVQNDRTIQGSTPGINTSGPGRAEAETKKHNYMGAFNANLVRIFPKGCSKVLDVGCADGVFGQVLLRENLSQEVVGIEINPTTAELAKERLTTVYCENVEEFQLPFPEGYFDCLVYGDSLEHLRDPEVLLKNHLSFLRPGGYIVCSIPNIRNLFIIHHLLHGSWIYTNWGILDRTHLRFYTLNEIGKMFHRLGLKIEHIEPSLRDGQWYAKMYGPEAVSPGFIEIYNGLLQKCLNGDDITGDLKQLHHFDSLAREEAVEFFAAQFHLRAVKT